MYKTRTCSSCGAAISVVAVSASFHGESVWSWRPVWSSHFSVVCACASTPAPANKPNTAKQQRATICLATSLYQPTNPQHHSTATPSQTRSFRDTHTTRDLRAVSSCFLLYLIPPTPNSTTSKMAEIRRKLVIVGDGACGKTCLLM